MEKKLFKVEISSTGLSTESDEVKGFLDNKKVQDYEDFDINLQPIEGETVEQYIIKARGYIRWRQMSYNISKGGIFYIGKLETEGADHITPPTKMTFYVGYEQFDGMNIEDELNDGAILSGIPALKRRIALSLVDDYKLLEEYYDNSVYTNNRLNRINGSAEYDENSDDATRMTLVSGYCTKFIEAKGPAIGETREEKIAMAESLVNIEEIL